MVLEFDSRLYTLKAVEEAASAHGELAEIRIEEDGRVIAVEAGARSGALDDAFADEFCNYVLGCLGR